MEKDEFIDKFASSANTKERNASAVKASMGMVKFYYEQEIPSLDFCEICVHPKGRTLNTFEMCMSIEEIDPARVTDFKDRSKQYHAEEYGKDTNIILNIVIPPEPKMIMELGEHINALKELDIVITIYDPKNDKKGAFPVNEDFFSSLREDADYEGMSDSEIFQNFMMNYAELL
jgi:hypothetical protein